MRGEEVLRRTRPLFVLISYMKLARKGGCLWENRISRYQIRGMMTLSDARRAGYSKDQFYRYVREKGLERAGHGIYVAKDSFVDELFLLHRCCPQGVFSHEEALYVHDLTDREPTQHVLTIYTGYNTKRLAESRCRVYTVKKGAAGGWQDSCDGLLWQ